MPLKWLAVIIAAAACGCSTPEPKRSVAELYYEAMAASETHRQNLETFRQSHSAHPPLVAEGDPHLRKIEVAETKPTTHNASQELQLVADETPSGPQMLVSDIFTETDVRDAIQSLAMQAKVSVIVDEQIHGATNALIEDEPFEQALRKVLLPLGYVYHKTGREYVIGVADPESSLFPLLAQRVDYLPRHLPPPELLMLLPDRFQKFVRIVPKRNLIIIEAPELIAAQIVTELERSDQPVPQVMLEAMVCVFSPECKCQFGLDLQQGLVIEGDEVLKLGVTGLTFAGAGSLTRVSDVFGDFSVTSAFLRLLAQEGYLQIRATPSVMAKDGEQANISIGRESYFSIQPPQVANAVLFRQDIEKVESGIALDIIPEVRGDHVTVTIERAEVSEDIRSADFGIEFDNRFPLINRRTVSTTVDVPDGHTIVIGGLVQKQVVDKLTKVPVLGDIPVVGVLFQQIDKQEKEVEVAIFLSPRIVHDTIAPAPDPAAIPPMPMEYNIHPAPTGPAVIPPVPGEMNTVPLLPDPNGDPSAPRPLRPAPPQSDHPLPAPPPQPFVPPKSVNTPQASRREKWRVTRRIAHHQRATLRAQGGDAPDDPFKMPIAIHERHSVR